MKAQTESPNVVHCVRHFPTMCAKIRLVVILIRSQHVTQSMRAEFYIIARYALTLQTLATSPTADDRVLQFSQLDKRYSHKYAA